MLPSLPPVMFEHRSNDATVRHNQDICQWLYNSRFAWRERRCRFRGNVRVHARKLLQSFSLALKIILLTIPPLVAAGFLLHRELPAVEGLRFAPQALRLG